MDLGRLNHYGIAHTDASRVGRCIKPELRLLAAFIAIAVAVPGVAAQKRPVRPLAGHWVGAWATSPVSGGANPAHFDNQTLRLIVHTSIGGPQVRIHLSNTFGAEPLTIGAVHIALRGSGSEIVKATDRQVTFSGLGSISIPAGALAVSDPVKLDTPAMADVAVSIFIPGSTTAATIHPMALQTSYVSPAGDFTGAEHLPAGATTTTSWPFLTGISVWAPATASAIVAFGDSITDGAASALDANGRWPDLLEKRLAARQGTKTVGVLNEGIGGNRLLHDGIGPRVGFGASALARFDRDVAAQPGVRAIIVLLGINDIGHPGAGSPMSEDVTADDIIAALKQLIARAHEHGMSIFGCTILPFEGTRFAGYYSPAKDLKRDAVNKWMREGGAFDGVVDFDKATRDPEHPARLLPAFDGGDHLHPSSAGMKAMADAIDLAMLP